MESPNADHVTLSGSLGPLGPRVASPSPTQVSDASSGTGETITPSGLLLFQPCDETGERLRPSLVVTNPDGTIRGGIDIGEPISVVATNSDCRAVIQSDTGATFVVDGATRATTEIDLVERSRLPTYVPEFGGKRWGLFQTVEVQGRFALVDFVTGQVTDLRDIYQAGFSPDGNTLAVVSGPASGGDRKVWLIPANDPLRLRQVAVNGLFDVISGYNGDHFLLEIRRGGRELLICIAVADGKESVIAHAKEGDLPWHGPSQFLAGRPEIAVVLPNRFVVISLEDERPRERFSVSGGYATAFIPPSGKRAVLVPSTYNRDRSHKYVDLERGTVQTLTGAGGKRAYVNDWGADERWLLMTLGTEQLGVGAPLTLLDAETGMMFPIPPSNHWKYISLDNETMLFDWFSSGHPPGCTLLDLLRGRLIKFDEPCGMLSVPCQFHDGCSNTVSLSADGKWAVYLTHVASDSSKKWTTSLREKLTRKSTPRAENSNLTVIECATGGKHPLGFAKQPVWLAP